MARFYLSMMVVKWSRAAFHRQIRDHVRDAINYGRAFVEHALNCSYIPLPSGINMGHLSFMTMTMMMMMIKMIQ